mgnify:CR=1 FL=1
MTSKVYVALRVKAAPERAFAAFVEEIGAWWRPNGLFQTTPRAPGRLSFEPGEGGRLVETGPTEQVYRAPAAAYTRQLIAAAYGLLEPEAATATG